MIHRKIPFAVSILILFTSLVIAMSLLLTTFGMHSSLKIREASTTQLVSGFQKALAREFTFKLDNANAIQKEMINYHSLKMYQTGETTDLTKLLRGLALAYRLLPDSLSAYVGFEDGRFLMLQDLPSIQKYLNYQIDKEIPADAIYRLRRIHYINDTKVEDIAFLDRDFDILMQYRAANTDFNPTERPWYKGATQAENSFVGKPYQFSNSDYMGITISHLMKDQLGVVGLDIAIEVTDQILAEYKLSPSSTSFIFMSDGTLISHPRRNALSELDQELIKISLQNLDESKKHIEFQTQIEGYEDYQVFLEPDFMKDYSDFHLAVIAPISELNQETDQLRRNSILTFLIVLAVGLILTIIASNKISKSINILSRKSEKIGQFELEESFEIHTRIKELNQLSNTLEKMRSGLQEFGRYVPRQLVKQIVQNDHQIDLKGENRNITVLFTDIEGFTSISETMAPDALLSQTSDYFEVFSPIIHKHQGIIDKYIGDSVMAFWNAPDLIDDHIYKACLAALEINDALQVFNQKMQSEGKPVFNTRIGLHTGPSIVGNMGSSDRKNFTIFGATVNLASRLEGMNKRYDSNLLISEDIYELVKTRLACRPLEKVVAKGSYTALTVYEVLGKNSDEKVSDICELSHKSFDEFYAGNTDEAIDLLNKIMLLSPKDKVISKLLERYQSYKKQGFPVDYLNGIHLDQK